jgi:CO/xanthine dehydrogenase FAD-binding subunit
MSLYPSFARPRSLQQAADLLASLSTGKVIIAGGQEIMPSVNSGTLRPEVYVDVGGLEELRGIAVDEASGKLAIGALTVHRELQSDVLVQTHAPLLAQAARKAGGGRQVHNRGTLGGNLVAMHPLYDIAPSLLVLGAEIEMIRGGDLVRQPLAEVMNDSRHGLGSDAILVRVLIAPMTPGAGSSYQKLKLSGGAYGSANAAAIVTLDGESIETLRLAVGAVSERLLDATEAASFLCGARWSEESADRLEREVSALVRQPLSDQQGSGEWRTAIAGIIAARACAAAVKAAGGGEG